MSEVPADIREFVLLRMRVLPSNDPAWIGLEFQTPAEKHRYALTRAQLLMLATECKKLADKMPRPS